MTFDLRNVLSKFNAGTTKFVNQLARPKLAIVRRFLQYGLVGGSGVLVDSCILFVLADTRMLAFPIFISKIIAAEMAMVNNFVWNDVWTFRSVANQSIPKRTRLKRFFKFNLICTGGVLMSSAVLALVVSCLNFHLILGNLIAITVGMVWNFGMNFAFTWRGMRLSEVKSPTAENL